MPKHAGSAHTLTTAREVLACLVWKAAASSLARLDAAEALGSVDLRRWATAYYPRGHDNVAYAGPRLGRVHRSNGAR